MTVDHGAGLHPSGQTSGSPQRPAHHLARPLLTFDLFAEVEKLRDEESWRRNRRNARTLVKEPDLRIVLVALQSGARLEEHRAPGRISIQTVQGHVRVHVPGHEVELPAGHILTLEPNIAHDVEAQDDSAFLLTIAWPAPAADTASPRKSGNAG